MQTRRDQFQAYKYLVRRVLASMIGNDPEAPEQPMRRVGGATAIGVLFAGLACGGVAVYGWLVGSISDNWKKEDNIVVREKETGAQFVYMTNSQTKEKELRPIPNFTTAQLLTGSAEPTVEKLTSGSLNTVPKGTGIGIPDAPALLPTTEELTPTPWTVCSRPQRDSDRNKQAAYQTDVLVGHDDIHADQVGDGRAVVVYPEGNEDQLYVLYDGKRLAATREAVTALDFRDEPLAVSPTLLNAIPEGQTLAGPKLDGAGNEGVPVGGETTAIGQVFTEQEQEQYWIMDADGTRPIGAVQAHLLLAPGGGAKLPGGADQTEPKEIPQSELQAESTGETVPEGDLPTEYPLTAPKLADDAEADSATVCAWYEGTGEPELTVNGEVPTASTAAADAAAGAQDGSGTGALLADHTIVQPGKGAVVGVEPRSGDKPSVYYVVTDSGKRYQMSSDALGTLGYSGGGFDPPTLPSHLIKLVPEGPALTAKAANETWVE